MFTVRLLSHEFSQTFESAESVHVVPIWGDSYEITLHRGGGRAALRLVIREERTAVSTNAQFFSAIIENAAGKIMETFREPPVKYKTKPLADTKEAAH